MSDADRRRVANGSHRHVGGVNLQDGDVDRRVAPGNRGRDHPTVRARHGNFLVDVHRVVGGDDQPGTPVHAGRTQPRPRVDPEHRPTRMLHSRRQLVRKRQQSVHRALLGM